MNHGLKNKLDVKIKRLPKFLYINIKILIILIHLNLLMITIRKNKTIIIMGKKGVKIKQKEGNKIKNLVNVFEIL
jgi:hypothetical protein